MPSFAIRRRACALSLVIVAGCSGGNEVVEPDPVATIEVSPGSTSAAALGQSVAFTAVARGSGGSEISGVSFSWSSSATTVATVDGSGVATAVSDGSTLIRATAQGITGSADLTVDQQPAAIAVIGGNAQSGLARVALTVPLRVRVTDSRGNPVPDTPVTWQILTGGGSLTGTATSSNGEATATWTMGTVPGPSSARATVGAIIATFSATALPNGVIQGTISRSSAFLVGARAAAAGARAAAMTEPGVSKRPQAAPTGPAQPVRDRGPIEDELLVRVRAESLALPPVGSSAYRSPAQAGAAASTLRAAASRWDITDPFEVLGASPALATVRIRVPRGRAAAVRQRLAGMPDVVSVEDNQVAWASEDGTSSAPAGALSEPDFTRQAWHYDVTNVVRAWAVTTGSANVIVAVVDDGIRFDHPDIAANLRSDGYDFVTLQSLTACTSGSFTNAMDGNGPDPDPTKPAELNYDDGSGCVVGLRSTGGHGLHVAGTIGARAANGQGGVGVAWQVSIRPIRVLGSHGFGTYYDIAQGILYAAGLPADGGTAGVVQAASPARVINLSLGGTGGSSTLHDAVIAATNAGSLVVAAAGNSNSSVPSYPAAYAEALSVSALGPDLARAPYSNFSSTVDIAAPGGALGNGSDYGVWSLRWDFSSGSPIYDALQGTSMATPHVAGIAALVLSASPGLTLLQLRARLLDHAIDLGSAGVDDVFGAGLVNAEASVRNGVPRDTYIRAYDEPTGALRGSVRASANGVYSLDGLPDGAYLVYAGDDANGDLISGLFDRRWGALGGSTSPSTVTITQSSVASASFSIGYPLESEPNGSTGNADALPVGSYAFGSIQSGSDVDVYSFRLASTKTIVVQTDAFQGACGFTDQVDTMVRLLAANGSELAQNDDESSALGRHCSRIQMQLGAGTYYVEVTGWSGDQGFYGVRVSEGS